MIEPEPAPTPVLLEAAAAANPGNVLSAVVTLRALHAHSAAVEFGAAPGPFVGATPLATLGAETAVLPVLGLFPETEYVLRVVVHGAGGHATSETMTLTTDALPEDLPAYVASGEDPAPGYVVFAAGRYGLAIDNTGRVVWYRAFQDGPGLNFHRQPNGHFYARPPAPEPGTPAVWHEIDVLGTLVRTFGCAHGLQPRFHDLIVEPGGAHWVLCDQTRTMDLSELGGFPGAQVTATTIQRIAPGGQLLFAWNPFDHFDITDIDDNNRSGPEVNWTHGNSFDLDAQGHLLVSFRNLNEVTKIDTRTGVVLWRMGGIRNEFAFEGTTMPAFARQHSVRVTGPGSFMLLDNLGDPEASRAERYVYDEAVRTARLAAWYAPAEAVVAQLGGTVQALAGGRTLVTFGSGGRVEEYDAAGASVWRIDGSPGYVFSAQRIHSLYPPR